MTRRVASVVALWGLGALLGSRPGAAIAAAGNRAPGAQDAPLASRGGSQIRFARFAPDRIYHLRGVSGYELDVQFAPGEHVTGIGVGDAKAIKVAAAANHLFIKPRAARVATDLTVLTNRRTYLFDYRVGSADRAGHPVPVVYAVRFEYPQARHRRSVALRRRSRVDRDLARAERSGPRNTDYWYCGARVLRPESAWDDGVQTHLTFPSREELPAVFVRNADGSESLVNFDMRGRQMVIHRIARRFILKRGRLTGCIVNKGFSGTSRRLPSGTLSPHVWRVTRGERAPAVPGSGERR